MGQTRSRARPIATDRSVSDWLVGANINSRLQSRKGQLCRGDPDNDPRPLTLRECENPVPTSLGFRFCGHGGEFPLRAACAGSNSLKKPRAGAYTTCMAGLRPLPRDPILAFRRLFFTKHPQTTRNVVPGASIRHAVPAVTPESHSSRRLGEPTWNLR